MHHTTHVLHTYQQFLEKEHCEENILFWRDAEEFKKEAAQNQNVSISHYVGQTPHLIFFPAHLEVIIIVHAHIHCLILCQCVLLRSGVLSHESLHVYPHV